MKPSGAGEAVVSRPKYKHGGDGGCWHRGWSGAIDGGHYLIPLARAGFTITAAGFLDVEMGSRLSTQNSVALASSICLVVRRENSVLGDYATEVKLQLAQIVKERVKTLMEEGVIGADIVIACVGAGLRAYTQCDRVELPNGDELDAQTFLDEVQKVKGSGNQNILNVSFRQP